MKKKSKTSAGSSRYITRTKAVKKLQITVLHFRKLCVYRGLYPIVPHSAKLSGSKKRFKIYYYKKDISRLQNDPLILKLREIRVYKRKLNRFLNKREWLEAKILEDNKPSLDLDEVVKKRYPTFSSVFQDLDDCLTVIFMTASLPIVKMIRSGDILECSKLALEFKNYIVQTKSLRKVFVTVKGIYYQADIMGHTVTWVEPFKFVHEIPKSVDMNIISDFSSLHMHLLKHILIHIYKKAGLIYPPRVDLLEYNMDSGIGSLINESGTCTLSSRGNLNNSEQAEPATNGTIDEKSLEMKISLLEKNISKEGDDLSEDISNNKSVDLDPVENELPWESLTKKLEELKTLFKGCVFFLSREVPVYSLEFIIKAFYGKVGWDQYGKGKSHMTENNPTITHFVTDRGSISGEINANRFYIQPQWVYDSINSGKLLDPNLYAPGFSLPPHLSPFVIYKKGDYIPDEAKELLKENGAYEDLVEDVSASLSEETVDDENDIYEAELEAEKQGLAFSEYLAKKAREESKGPAVQRDLNKKDIVKSSKKSIDKEKTDLAMSMMSKKTKKKYKFLTSRKKRKTEEVKSLIRRKKNLVNRREVMQEV